MLTKSRAQIHSLFGAKEQGYWQRLENGAAETVYSSRVDANFYLTRETEAGSNQRGSDHEKCSRSPARHVRPFLSETCIDYIYLLYMSSKTTQQTAGGVCDSLVFF